MVKKLVSLEKNNFDFNLFFLYIGGHWVYLVVTGYCLKKFIPRLLIFYYKNDQKGKIII